MNINMKIKPHDFLQLITLLQTTSISFMMMISTSTSQLETPQITHCGNITIQSPFLISPNPNSNPSHQLIFFNHMILCKSSKPYLRTTLGLLQISSINYTSKLITLSHSKPSSTSDFLSPSHLSAGLAAVRNSLILYNCKNNKPSTTCNGTAELAEGFESCYVVDDVAKGFDAREIIRDYKCTHYRRVFRGAGKYEAGTRISFDVPDHVPNPCDQCRERGDCGPALRCVCHPVKCKDKVISIGPNLKPCGDMILICLVLFIIVMGF